MTQRLPIPGSDNGTWGSILNGFLGVSLNADGTLKNSSLGSAGATLATNNLSDLVSQTTALQNLSAQQLIGYGTYATRPVSGATVGAIWVQTDAAGGNQALTWTRWDGSSWDNISPTNQIAGQGMQGNTWISPLTNFGNSAPSSNELTASANQMFLQLVRPTKNITVASIGAYIGNTVGHWDLGIYQVTGSTLTLLSSLGGVAVPGTTIMARNDLPSTVTLYAGTSYYFAVSNDQSGGLYLYSWPNTNRWGTFIGGTPGEAPVFNTTSGTYYPLPSSVDTTAWSVVQPAVSAMMAASSLT